MSEQNKSSRRQFLGTAAITLAAGPLAVLGSASAQTVQIPVKNLDRTKTVAADTLTHIKQINAGLLNIGYAELGPDNGPVVILLHGWPYDIHSYEEVAPLLAGAGYRVIVPYLRGHGTTSFLSPDTFRNGQQVVVAIDIIALMDALKIKKAVIGGFDWGARTACILAALWPDRCKGMVSVSGYLINNLERNKAPLPPAAELGWWYQYYFATDRGQAGYTANRNDFNKLIWKQASPKWNFSDVTFDRTAKSFENPDHVDIVIHNYRWRLNLAKGETQYDSLENKLSQGPLIGVPSITIASDFDGAAATGTAYAKKFSGKYEHRILKDIGHNLPQEAPEAFAKAIQDVDHFSH